MSTFALRLPLHGLRSQFLHWAYTLLHPLYGRVKQNPRPAWQINKVMLLEYAPGTLGRAVGQFLAEHELELISSFENHDVFHVLLGFGLSAPEEVALQWCLLGNGKRSIFLLAAILMGSFCFPEHWGWFRNAYRKGRRLRAFHHWYFEYLLQENLSDMRDFLEGGHVREEEFRW